MSLPKEVDLIHENQNQMLQEPMYSAPVTPRCPLSLRCINPNHQVCSCGNKCKLAHVMTMDMCKPWTLDKPVRESEGHAARNPEARDIAEILYTLVKGNNTDDIVQEANILLDSIETELTRVQMCQLINRELKIKKGSPKIRINYDTIGTVVSLTINFMY